MSEKDIRRLMDLAREELRKGITREEAIRSLMDAGILDKDGHYTKPYQNLSKAIRK